MDSDRFVVVYGWLLYDPTFGVETSEIWYNKPTSTTNVRMIFDKETQDLIAVKLIEPTIEGVSNEDKEPTDVARSVQRES